MRGLSKGAVSVWGNFAIAQVENMIYLETAITMFALSDGLHHSSNDISTFEMDGDQIRYISEGTLSSKGYGTPSNYVSHSFNQFAASDSEGNMIVVDHGDGYPRSVQLVYFPYANLTYPEYPADEDDLGEVLDDWSSKTKIDVITIPGEVGDNYTGVEVSDLRVPETGTAFISGITRISDGKFKKSNVFLNIVDYKTGAITQKLLTRNNGKYYYSAVKMAPAGSGRTILCFLQRKIFAEKLSSTTMHYFLFDGKGKALAHKKYKGAPFLSCSLEVINGQLLWSSKAYVKKGKKTYCSALVFAMNVKNPAKPKILKGKYMGPDTLYW
jgi:hypothetical protein